MEIALLVAFVFGGLCLVQRFVLTKDETSLLCDIIFNKENIDKEKSYKFEELDQEIAEKEKELNSLKELKKKEKKLNDLNNQIEQYSDVSKTLSDLGSTMEEIGQPLYNAKYGHIPIYISESNTNNKFFNNALTSNGGIDLSKYGKNIIMSAEEIREKQKNTHWSEDKELLKVYEESKHKALKEIEQLIQETIVGNKNIVEYAYLDTYDYMYETKQDLPIFNLKENVPTETAQIEFPQEIIKDLELLGYKAQQKERVFKKIIRVEW